MEEVPPIDRDALLAVLAHRFPEATIDWAWVNRSYGSWAINILKDVHRIEITWGPLSGFGATDQNNMREETNPFGAFDWPLNNEGEAVEFVERIVGASSTEPEKK